MWRAPTTFSCAFLAVSAITFPTWALPPQTDEQRAELIKSLQWRDGEKVTLPRSSAIIKAPNGLRQVIGKDSVNLFEAVNGVVAPDGIEAMLYNPKSEVLSSLQHLGSGYIRLDDWGDVDPDEMIKAISENTEAENAVRSKAGVNLLHVTGWLEKPRLDRSKSTVTWSIKGTDGGQPLVNMVALVLGRDGYEKLVAYGANNADANAMLQTTEESFQFAKGSRHEDYQVGDKVAEFGVAGLVATVLGAKVAAKVGLFALAAVLVKKAGVIIVLVVGVIAAWIKRLFSRQQRSLNPKPPPLPPTSV